MDLVSLKGTLESDATLKDFRITGPEAVEDPSRLDGAPFLAFLAWIAMRKATGVARVEPANGVGTLLGFSQGGLLTCEDDGRPFNDDVLAWLVEQRVVDGPRLEAIRAASTGTPILQALFAHKACTPQDLVEAIKASKERLLGRFLQRGRWAFQWQDKAAVKRTDPVVVDLAAFIVSSMRLMTRSSYASDMDPLLKDMLGRYPNNTGALTPAQAEVIFSDKERMVLEQAADGTTTLKDGIAMSLLSHSQTDRLILIAAFLGFIEFRTLGLPKGGVETLEKELKSNYERLKGEDHFQRLGVHWTTHPKHYPDAYRKMAERWGPGSRVRQHSAATNELAIGVMDLMDEAFAVIQDPEARAGYRLARFGKETIIFGTDFLYKQAHLAVFREEWDLAQEIIESAIDIRPKGEYTALRNSIINHAVRKE